MTLYVRCVSCGGEYAPRQGATAYAHVCPPLLEDEDAAAPQGPRRTVPGLTIDGRPARNENPAPDWTPEERKHPSDPPRITAEGLGVVPVGADER